MIELLVNTQSLDLKLDSKVQITEASPLFDRDGIQRGFSFPFKIPATITNQKALQYPTRIDGAGQRKYANAQLKLFGLPYENGVLVITASNQYEIEVAFQNANLDILEQLKNYKLREDLSMPVSVLGAYRPIIHLKIEYDAGADLTKYCALGVNNQVFTRLMSERSQIVDDINAAFPGLASVFSDQTIFLIIALDSSTIANPTFSVRPAIDDGNTYKYFDLEIIDVTEEESLLADYKAHVESVLASPDDHIFPTVYFPNFYDGKNSSWRAYVNYYSKDEEYPLRLFAEETGWEYTLVPMVFVKSVFEAIFEKVGISSISGTFFADALMAQLLVYNNRSIDYLVSPASFLVEEELYRDQILTRWASFLPSYNLEDHLPDLNFFEFLSKFATTFPIVLQIKNGAMQIDAVDDLISVGQIELTEYTEEVYNQRYTTFSSYAGTYDRQDTPVDSENFLSDISGGASGDQNLRLTTEFFTLYFRELFDEFSGEPGRSWLLSFDQGVGYSIPGAVQEEMDLRLLFYYGLQPDSLGNNYPYASFFPNNYAGQIIGNYSLEWDRVYGFYEQWWANYIEILMADELDAILYLPIQKLLEVKNNITTPIYIKHPSGSFKGFIKKFDFSVSVETGNIIAVKAQIAKV